MKEKDWPEPMALCLARNVVEVDLGGKVETTLVLSLTDQPRPDEQWFRERVSDLRRDGTPIRTIAEILGATKSKVEHAIRALARDALRYEEAANGRRSEEHTSELQSLMRISYAVFCLKKKKYQ